LETCSDAVPGTGVKTMANAGEDTHRIQRHPFRIGKVGLGLNWHARITLKMLNISMRIVFIYWINRKVTDDTKNAFAEKELPRRGTSFVEVRSSDGREIERERERWGLLGREKRKTNGVEHNHALLAPTPNTTVL